MKYSKFLSLKINLSYGTCKQHIHGVAISVYVYEFLHMYVMYVCVCMG